MKTQEKKHKVQCINKRIKEESLSYIVEVRDRNGWLLQRISAPSRSYVQQYNQLISGHAALATRTIKDVDGVNQSTSVNLEYIDIYLGLSVRVGKGTTPVAITDYVLESPCGEGTGTDEFNHQAGSFTSPSVVGSSCSFTFRRSLINNSGATITGINEIGCYLHHVSYAFLGWRDILPSPISVPDGGAITITYTIKATV